MSRTIIYLHVNITLDFPIPNRNVLVLSQSEYSTSKSKHI